MRLILVLLVVLYGGVRAAAQPPAPEPGGVEDVRARAEAYVQAYNAHDAAKLAGFWSESAVYVHPNSGARIVGREAIQKMFETTFAEEPNLRLEVTIDSVRLITPEVAIEDGQARVFGEGDEPAETTYTAVHVRKDDQWQLDSVRETVAAEAPAEASAESYEHLKHLEWMVGDWIDQSEESTVETTCRWAANKSFLTRTFKVSAPDWADLQGTQIIGWDPRASAIRVWTFDSDGGYAEGVVSRVDDNAVVRVQGFTPDGRDVAAVQIYRKIDDDTFAFRSVGRVVGDERMPDLDEVRVVRKSAPSP